MKKAILGGSFDPITLGHIQLCSKVLEAGIVEQVVLVPSFTHHYGKKLQTFEHRFNMCRTALKDGIAVSSYEAENETPRTYNLIMGMKEEYPDDDWHFIIGMDSAPRVVRWYKSRAVLKEIKFIVIDRQGVKTPENAWFNEEPHIYLQEEIMDVSSTQVREALKPKCPYCDTDLTSMLDKQVLEYIISNQLYV